MSTNSKIMIAGIVLTSALIMYALFNQVKKSDMNLDTLTDDSKENRKVTFTK